MLCQLPQLLCALPMGMTRVMYSLAVMLCDLTSPSTRTAKQPIAEQKPMCHIVKAIGNGKPLYASSHCTHKNKKCSNNLMLLVQGSFNMLVVVLLLLHAVLHAAAAPGSYLVEKDDCNADGHPYAHVCV